MFEKKKGFVTRSSGPIGHAITIRIYGEQSAHQRHRRRCQHEHPGWRPYAGINDERTKRSVLIEEGLGNLAVAAHPDSGVSLLRVGEHLARSLAITGGGAVH